MAAATGAAVTLNGFLRTDVPSALHETRVLAARRTTDAHHCNPGWLGHRNYAHWVKDTVTGLLIGPDYQKNKDR